MSNIKNVTADAVKKDLWEHIGAMMTIVSEDAASHSAVKVMWGAEQLMVLAKIVDWIESGFVAVECWDLYSRLETSQRDYATDMFVAWAAKGKSEADGFSVRTLFSASGWDRIRKYLG